MSAGDRSARQGRLARLGLGAVVALTSVLALVVLVLVNWLLGRPGLRQRWDLTRSEQNTLSTAAQGVVRNLRETVTVDVFFRPEEPPLTDVGFAAQERTRRLLQTFRESSSGRIEVRENDPRDAEAIEARARELRLQGFENCIVLSVGERREALTLRRDLATFDPGRPKPDPRAPSITSFDAERAIVRALLEVTAGEELAVYFAVGHGERGIFDETPAGMSRLQSLLAEEGLVVNRWSPVEDGPLPEDCTCLTLIGPSDGYDDATLDAVEAYVRRGGRLVVAPHSDDRALERSRLGELVERFGVEIQPGTVCQAFRDPTTGTFGVGLDKCSAFAVLPDNISAHPLLAPIKESRRSFLISGSHPVRLVRQPEGGGTSSVLFRSVAQDGWVETQRHDRPEPFDWTPTPDELQGRRMDLAVAGNLPLLDAAPAALEERPEGRFVVIGSSFAFTNALFDYNADFLRNVYNWVLDREYRILISPRDPALVRFAPEDSEKMARVARLAWGWIPLACVVLGLVTGFWRALGGPRKSRSDA